MDAITYEINNESNNRINNALMMSEKDYIKSQQTIIDSFYKEYFTYDISNVGYWLVSGIFTFIQLVFSAFPMQQMMKEGLDKEFLGVMAFVIMFPVFFYQQAFLTGKESFVGGYGRVNSLYSIIKYLPVSLAALKLYRFKKMLNFVVKVFLGCTILQLGISLLAFHGITWANLVFLLVYGFLIPFFIGCCQTFFVK
ncbi:MAG: hypothetical protein IJP13_06230 [Lachnospiraceae bacterium]|nr:hypothetical protein [Lachnospiraceae bacterium]MBQ6815118.1 hypothetical protein [Lachnospiraceae bacterium]